MAQEIERRFLLKNDAWRALAAGAMYRQRDLSSAKERTVCIHNAKPANISYLTNQYSTWDSFKFGMIQILLIIALLVPWTHYVMPLMGFKSQRW